MAYRLDSNEAAKSPGSIICLPQHPFATCGVIYDPADGEICPTFFIRVEDEQPTSDQSPRLYDRHPRSVIHFTTLVRS